MRSPDTVTVAITRAANPLAVMHLVATEFTTDAPTVEDVPVLTDAQRVQYTRWARTITADVVETELAAARFDDVLSWRFIDRAHLPTDRTFRDAFMDGGPDVGISVDLDRARELRRDQLREARAPLLAELDTAYMRALESGDATTQAQIVARKQALRDVTADPAIDAATTVEALKAAGSATIASATADDEDATEG